MKLSEIMSDVFFSEATALNDAGRKLQNVELSDLGSQLKVLKESNGSLIFCGVGKSGLIGQKLAATFMSLGLSSYFLHPTEALHGDLGRVKSTDLIVLISKSGTTEEITKILPYLPIDRKGRIAFIGATNSPIAKECATVFDCSVEKEACVNNQAPTTSATVTLAMGHALAVLFEKETGLSKEGFAENHPGGLLGKSLRLQVKHLITSKENCPIVSPHSTLKDALVEMTRMPVGGLAVVEGDKFLGLVVDGDIRRSLAREEVDLSSKIDGLMNKTPQTITLEALAIDGLKMMESGERSFSILPVIEQGQFVGFLRLHDLVREGFK